MSDTQQQKQGFLAFAWDLFASVRLTVGVLLALAGTAIIGTLIPQTQPAAFYAAKYGEAGARLIAALQIDDMYRSHWFQALILMLAANILVCSVARLKTVWKIVFSKTPAFSENAFNSVLCQLQNLLQVSRKIIFFRFKSFRSNFSKY